MALLLQRQEAPMKLVKMTRYDGHKVNVHPSMVDDYKTGGYVVDDDQGDPLDHDKDGQPGGSADEGEVSPELEKLRADAKALGIKVHWKHSAETIQAAIDAKLAE